MDAAHPVGPTSGTWAQIRPPGAAQGPPGLPKGPFWAKTGPFGGPRSAVEVSQGARAHDMNAAHLIGPTSGTWAKIRPPGLPRAPKRAFLGQNGPFLGPQECCRGLLGGPSIWYECGTPSWTSHWQSGPNQALPGLPEDLWGPQEGLFGPKLALLGPHECLPS